MVNISQQLIKAVNLIHEYCAKNLADGFMLTIEITGGTNPECCESDISLYDDNGNAVEIQYTGRSSVVDACDQSRGE